MSPKMKWYDYLAINSYWLGINTTSAVMTPVLLPYLVLLFMPPEQKNTSLATVRVIGLSVAMLIKPLAGMLSDRNTSRWGRRRPYIMGGALFNILFLVIIGASTLFVDSSMDGFFGSTLGIPTAFFILILGYVLLQVSSNFALGALQGLIPDQVPDNQRGRASGVKAVLELLPAFLVIFIGPLVDSGKIWLTLAIIMIGLLVTMLTTVLFVHEEPLQEKPKSSMREPALRMVALTVIFVLVSQLAVFVVKSAGTLLSGKGASLGVQVALVGLAGLLAMAGSIFVGVYFGARVGIGQEAREQRPFILWVVNRLLFLSSVGSIQGFAQYYMSDVLQLENAATMTTTLLAVVALFLMLAAIFGGMLADKIGRKRLIEVAGLVAALGTLILLFARNIPLVMVSGCIIGLGAGLFMATNWALGTDLVPKNDAGRYLGISNLAGAGAGIVGTGIGGPMADFFNTLQPGLGYIIIFAIYGGLFVISTLVIHRIKVPKFHAAEG